MQYEWDPFKAAKVKAERGLRFQDAVQLLEGPHFTFRSDQFDEERWRAVGELNGSLLTVVYTVRGKARRIITFRRAWASEERAYRQLFP